MLLARRLKAHPILVGTGVLKPADMRDGHRIPSVAAFPVFIEHLLNTTA